MEGKRFCVSYGKTTKLIKVQTATYEDVKMKVIEKFQLEEPVCISVKLDEFDQYVDVDETDDNDILEQAKHILIRMSSTADDSASSECSASTSQTSEVDEVSISSLDNLEQGSSSGESCFDVQAIVDEHPQGQRITDQYQKNGILTPETRMLLVNIITAKLVQRFTYYPSAEQKTMAAKGIIKAYPNLKNKLSKLGYEHFFSAQGGQSGYIQDKLKNLRRTLPSSNLKRPRMQKAKSGQPSSSGVTVTKRTKYDECIPEEQAEELISFCRRSSSEAKDEIIVAMEKLFPNRQKWLNEDSPCIDNVLEKYPRFQDIPILIDQEFRLMYGDSNQLLSKWDTKLTPGILHLGNLSRSAKVQGLVESLTSKDNLQDYEPSLDKKSMYAFHVLLNLLPSSTGKHKCTSRDLTKLFIEFKPVGTSIDMYLQTKGRMQRQPFLLCLGTMDDPRQFFVILDTHAIPCSDNITSAADRLFKLHYVLNLHYAKALEFFYIFLEVHVYNINLPGRKVPSKVAELISNLAALKL